MSWVWDIRNAFYDGVFHSFGTAVDNTRSIDFTPDGSSAFLVARDGVENPWVRSYDLATPWDISSAGPFQAELDLSSLSNAHGISIRHTGDKMFIGNRSSVLQYNLSTAWDIETATLFHDDSLGGQLERGHDIDFSRDGMVLYCDDRVRQEVLEFQLNTAWDLSTVQTPASFLLDVSEWEQLLRGIEFNDDGTMLFMCDSGLEQIVRYDLTTPWDLSTASDTGHRFDFSAVMDDSRAVTWREGGERFYLTDRDAGNVLQFEVTEEGEVVGDPIADWHDLDAIRSAPTQPYFLANDLDATTAGYADYNTGDGWLPIPSFSGMLHGDGHAISDLVIDRPATLNVALFDQPSGEIRDLSVSGEITGSREVAMIAAVPSGATFHNCHVTGTLTSSDGRIGGLCSSSSTITVTNSTADVNITDTNRRMGGLIARLESGPSVVSRSAAFGSVNGGSETGGLVGEIDAGTIEDCYSLCDVTSTNSLAGGCVGNAAAGTIQRCYAAPDQLGNTSGGFVGANVAATVTDCFWDEERSGVSASASGTGLETDAMTGSAELSGFVYPTIWRTVEFADPDSTGDGYPIIVAHDSERQLNQQNLFQAMARGDRIIRLRWTDTETSNDGFNIYAEVDPSGETAPTFPNDFGVIGQASSDAEVFTDMNAANEDSVWYAVTAFREEDT